MVWDDITSGDDHDYTEFSDIDDNPQVSTGGGRAVGGDGPRLSDLEDEGGSGDGGSGGKKSSPMPDPNIFGFKVEANTPEMDYSFIPEYYPERFNVTREREQESKIDSCKTELLIYKYIKGSRIHAKGITLMDEEAGLEAFRDLANDRLSECVVTNPILPYGGSVVCHIDKAEYGEWEGYDPINEDYFISYSLDLISLGSPKDRERSGIIEEMDSLGGEFAAIRDETTSDVEDSIEGEMESDDGSTTDSTQQRINTVNDYLDD